MSVFLKRLFIALGITILIVGSYFLYINLGHVSPAVSTDILEQKNTSEEIFKYSQQIGSLSVDSSILNDSRFNSLKDIQVNLVDVPTGRTNPFAETR